MDTRELRAAIRQALDDHEGDRDEQVAAVTGVVAGVIEQACRPDDRWAPKRRRERGEGPKQQRRERESA